MEEADKPKLKLYEWGAVIVYITLLATISLYTLVYIPGKYPAIREDPHWLLDPYIDVYITGAVKHPGRYSVRRGSTRGRLLTRADPLPNADFTRVKTTMKLKEGELVEIPPIEMVTINITGEVENPGPLRVPKKTKVFELQDLIEFKEGADLTVLEKKRAVKGGEFFMIMKKKS